MTPTAQWLADAHDATWPPPDEWYESVRALMLLAAISEAYGMTDQHFERMATAIRSSRSYPQPVNTISTPS